MRSDGGRVALDRSICSRRGSGQVQESAKRAARAPRPKPSSTSIPSRLRFRRGNRRAWHCTSASRTACTSIRTRPRMNSLSPRLFRFRTVGGAAGNANYPPGTDFSLPVDPGTKLNVYTGEFAIQTRVYRRGRRPHRGGQAPLPGLRPECVPAAEDDHSAHRCGRKIAPDIPGLDLLRAWEKSSHYAPAFFSILAQESFSGQRAVEHQLVRRRVGVEAEVADALELEAVLELRVGQRRLQLGVR